MGVFDELRSQSKEIEKELDRNLEVLFQLNQKIHPETLEVTSEKNPENSIISRISSLLTQLKEIHQIMQKTSSSPLEKSSSSLVQQLHISSLKRLKDLQNSIQDKRWQQQLLGNQINSTDFSKTEILLKEEKFLDESMEIGRSILETAKEARVSLAYQSQRLTSTQEKITRFAQMVPGINFLMKRISARQQFNALVLGIAIAICLCIVAYKIL
jgi:hypothetical protein